jgi:5-methyltetrahydropteroyltriglutamate--homocysteine methyltransferase
MTTTAPICRADHIGSLLRPEALRRAYRDHAAGKLDDTEFKQAQDQAISDVIAMQENAGMGAVTDGEFRRRSWFAGFVDAVDGLVHKDTYFKFVEGEEASVSVPVPHAEAPIRRSGGITTDEFTYASSVANNPVKITMPAPSVIHFFRGPDGMDRTVYPNDDAYWDDLIAVYQEEIRALADLGLTYLQLDEVPIALFCDEQIRERLSGWGADYKGWYWDQLLERYIQAANAVLDARPAGMRAGMHLCRGNFRGKFIGTGSYDVVAERLFNEVNVDQFLLEYDTERAGDFAPLRYLPADKSAVLGLVSTKTAAMEDEGNLRRRLDDAQKYVPMDRLAISPQCGFGTTVGGAPMTEDDERQKLELVGRVAATAWQ